MLLYPFVSHNTRKTWHLYRILITFCVLHIFQTHQLFPFKDVLFDYCRSIFATAYLLYHMRLFYGTITADEMLRDHVDVDWGSIAWRANKAELLRFFEVCKLNVSSLKQLEPAKDYAVVFIEAVWGDSA